MRELVYPSYAKPLPAQASGEKSHWWTSDQRKRSILAKISTSDVARLWGQFSIEDIDSFDEFEVAIDPHATLETGAAVALIYPDGSGPGLGVLRTKNPKRAKLFSVDLLLKSGDIAHIKNHFTRDWLGAIVGLEAIRNKSL